MTKDDTIIFKQRILEELLTIEPFLTAHEVSEKFDITPQAASGLLRKMENEQSILSKKIKAGRGEVKCYFLER